jgi:hypothetical protein
MGTFLKGAITGAGLMLALVLILSAFRFFNERDRKIYEAMELQHEIEELQQDYSNRDAADFLDDPGVRGAADSARDDYYRRIDEILQRYGGEQSN